MSLLAKIFKAFGVGQEKVNDGSPERTVSLDTQMDTFRELGFVLNSGTSMSDVDRWDGMEDFEKDPYSLLYSTLGQTIEREPWTPLTDRCWDFDTEAIEDHGAYVEIMNNMERITRGELKFENLKDYVDVEEETAWVSFSIGGGDYKWDLKIDDDWADPELFTKLVVITEKFKTEGRFTYFDTGGQNAVIGYETPENRGALNAATGLEIDWLS